MPLLLLLLLLLQQQLLLLLLLLETNIVHHRALSIDDVPHLHLLDLLMALLLHPVIPPVVVRKPLQRILYRIGKVGSARVQIIDEIGHVRVPGDNSVQLALRDVALGPKLGVVLFVPLLHDIEYSRSVHDLWFWVDLWAGTAAFRNWTAAVRRLPSRDANREDQDSHRRVGQG